MTIQQYDIEYSGQNQSEMRRSDNGEWVRFADLPKPPPWFKRPDSEGWWRFSGHDLLTVFQLLKSDDGRLIVFSTCRCESEYFGLWQRIPDAVPPSDGGGVHV